MAKHLYLPQLDKDANVPVPKQTGLWEKNTHAIILSISDGITIAEAEKARGISSVPDIWARALMFQSALKPSAKNPHPLRERIVQEWRGLLSLFALAKIKNYPLEIAPVELGDDIFSIALKNLAPAPVQLEEDRKYNWTNILMIRYDKIPIGAFSPTTLVYTATDYRERLMKKDLILKDEYGYLREPEHPEDLEAVGEWVCNLQKNLKRILDGRESNPDQKVVLVLQDLIEEWLKDLRKQLYLEEGQDIDSREVAVSSEPLETLTEKTRSILEKQRVYFNLLYPLQKVEVGEKVYHSDMALALTLGRNRSEYKEVVVITANLLGKNIKIWENLRLKDLGGDVQKCLDKYFQAPSGTMIDKENIGLQQAIWIRPEKYFLTDTLLKGKQGSLLMDGESEYNFGKKYLLPFKKELLSFFSPENIKEHLKPKFKEEPGGVRFSFTLPVASGLEEKVERFYKTKDIGSGEHGISEIDVPVLEIFPNYLDKNWRRYYLFHDLADRIHIYPVVDNPNPQIAQRVQEIISGEGKQIVEISEVSSDNAFPEGIEISNAKNNQEIFGLILIPRSPEPRDPDQTWKIGIDFGTSNTNVFRQSSAAEKAEQWLFDLQNQLRRITASENAARKKLLAAAFIPDDIVSLPTPTILRIFTLAKKDNLLLDYFIYFPTDYKTPYNVYSDIKWDTEAEKKTIYFLESLMFLLLIDVVRHRIAKVEIVCSYPKAFTPTNISVFKGDWERTLKKMLEDNESVISIHRGPEDQGKLSWSKPVYEIEGIAAGHYFGNEKTIENLKDRANIPIAAICLDIGGGTTDVSIWYDYKIVADTSVLLAGRQIAQLFQKNERVREHLFSKQGVIALDEKKNEPSFFAARLNVILKNEETRIQEMLLNHANKSDIQWLRKMLAFEFCAISFYTAMLTAATDRVIGGSLEKQTGLLHRIATDEIKLHWGGNAAKFINWIDFGKYDKDGIASKMLNALFFNCLKDVEVNAKSLGQLQSPGHKSEVSGGLVVMPLGTHGDGADQPTTSMEDKYGMSESHRGGGSVGTICGENIELADKKIDYMEAISGRDLFDNNSKTRFKSTSLDRLQRFIEIFNFFGIRFGLFTEDAKIKLTEQNQRLIRDEILSSFIKAQSLEEGQRVIEPIFIMEIRFFLEILRSELR